MSVGLLAFIGIHVPERFFASFELLVAAMLIVLGLSTLITEARRHRRVLGEEHAHAHHARVPHLHPERIRNVRGAFGFGIAHGLAGSGAVIVLLVAAASSVKMQFAYLFAFGVGTIGGMCLVTLLIGGVAGMAYSRRRRWAMSIRIAAATASMLVGTMLGWSVLAA